MSGISYRRKLPHVRVAGAVYFVTWRRHGDQFDLSAEERDCVALALRHFDQVRYVLHAYVVMNDHVHVLVEPQTGERLEDLLLAWKSYTANRLQRAFGRRGAIWQAEYFDRVIRGEKEYEQKRDYILNNAVKRWPNVTDYPWCWAIGLDV